MKTQHTSCVVRRRDGKVGFDKVENQLRANVLSASLRPACKADALLSIPSRHGGRFQNRGLDLKAYMETDDNRWSRGHREGGKAQASMVLSGKIC